MLPYPKTQAKLAEIAMQHNWWDIASALDVPVRFEEWVQAFRTNLPKGFDAWVKLTMCALNSVHFGGENDYAQMKQFAEKLCSRLAAMGKAGEMIAQPPNDGMKEVWQQFAEGGRDERQAE